MVKKLLWRRSFVHKACNIATIISFPFIREALDYLVKESLDRIYIRPALESIGAEDPNEIIFTSGGSESNNMALNSAMQTLGKDAVIISSPTEHSAILSPIEEIQKRDHKTV